MSANNNSAGGDALSSFVGLGGASGIDADTMNIFSSFTNDTGAAGNNNSAANGFAGITTGAMAGFGMDLGSFDITGDNTGGVDLTSMQLINLNDVPLGTNSLMNQQLGSTTDDAAAQLMARLLGPNTQQTTLAQQQRGLGLSTDSSGQAPTAPVNMQAPTGLRSGSESSDDLGDIPLAQLALGHAASGPDAQQNMAAMLQNQVAMQALAGMGTSAMPMQGFAMPGSQPAGGVLGMPQPNQTAGSVLNAALGDTLLAELMPSNLPPPTQQALPFLAQGTMSPATPHVHGLERAAGVGQQSFMPILANPLDPAPAQLDLLPAQPGVTGVHSSILPDPGSLTTEDSAVNPNLELNLPRPSVDTSRNLLDELEKIEEQLCTLLGTASKAIRMMAGPTREGDDGMELGAAKIKPTIREFMHLVAEVQAAMKYQHRRLTEQGISTRTVAGFQSDVAGFERDLVSWSDAARLLANALNTGLQLSAPAQ
ncbi:hypothetical protein IWW37_000626 [Coemansia sp. RSA 2050]|nr:hypothetical protein IWW37_000626 [Coemansia sp. RSA 2050]KAJ2732232.1 hypothetical protein IW152_003952 [Coemansia sp. BCRC 34962]